MKVIIVFFFYLKNLNDKEKVDNNNQDHLLMNCFQIFYEEHFAVHILMSAMSTNMRSFFLVQANFF